MSTKATVLFKECDSPMVKIYHHWDGNPEAFGLEIAEFFSKIQIVNGIGSGNNVMYSFGNGFGCAVAQFIKSIKDCVGNVYIDRIDSDEKWMDFSYIVNYNNEEKSYSVDILCFGKNIFSGNMEEFLGFCNDPVYEEEDEEEIPLF